MDLSNLLGIGAFPFVVGIVQVFKQMFPDAKNEYEVAAAFAAAEIITEAITYLQHGDYVFGALVGLATFLSAMGAWSGGKALLGK